ncbi:MAG TPA: hypothetical protein VGP72_01940 [Planctomycetota bacterium]
MSVYPSFAWGATVSESNDSCGASIGRGNQYDVAGMAKIRSDPDVLAD